MKGKMIEGLYQRQLSLFQTLGTFPLPELSDCKLPDGHCSSMTPQGICVTEHYIVITAYCSMKRFKKELKASLNTAGNQSRYDKIKNEPVHHSCLFVFSKKTHVYLALLELPDVNHVGGIAYDGKNLWVAKSTENCLSVIREQDLKKVMSDLKYSSKKEGRISYFQKEVPCGMTASFVTYFEGRIWVGSFVSKGMHGILQSFQVQKKSEGERKIFSLQALQSVNIPVRANGAYFYRNVKQWTEWQKSTKKSGRRDRKIWLFVNVSGGRKKSSAVYVFQVFMKENGKISCRKVKGIRFLPPLLEEGCIDGDILYTIYESSSPPYKDNPGNHCTFPVDVVCMAEVEKII